MPIILADVEQLLKETMGLDAASIGSLAIERACQERQAACRLDDPRAYWERVRSSSAELQALIEAVVVPETWFFREKEAFAAMVDSMHREWLPRHPNEVLRVLSLPCATGEEPYSISMALLDAGIPAGRFRIDAVDISEHALDEAQRAVYGKNSFRGSELGFRDRYFAAAARGWHVDDAVRRQVHFHRGNIFSPDFLPGFDAYDIIFCRNVLIYFDHAMQDRAIAVLARLLTKTGWLFVGSAETALLPPRGFSSMKMPLAFAFRKADPIAADVAKKARPAAAIKRPPPARPAVPPPRNSSPRTVSTTFSAPLATPAATLPTAMEQAQQLADQGRLEQAATLCEQHLQTHGPSPQAFNLLGLIQDARGDRLQAADYYRKVLYLDPQHSEALIHLACLLERQGDEAGAGLLRARLERVHGRVDANREKK